ncbi:helix-turn-helix domain-containing protein [Shewanella algae]|uniref:helix-turn-helix domain-containing protein n=1 Tax=Shewanella algae TaxID=38313 RepID=UPI001AAE12D9|nr:helix-turn-helix domain-containing protein [Shewanella algae]MBO2656181.1 helix-turn-helix domain-containing protein [Shewanella algae]
MHIPEKCLDNALSQTISPDTFQWLCRQYGGTYLNVPRCPKLRHALIFHLRDKQHWPFSRIARELCVTERWVYHVYRHSPLKLASEQLELF